MKKMLHQEYCRRLRSKSVPELMFIIQDASEAAAILPNGENTGYYLDEVLYASMELKRRGIK